MRFFILTMGCRINQYESQSIAEAWEDAGFTEVTRVRDADVVLINSCAVTKAAERDLRKHIRGIGRDAPDARLVVTGCAAGVMERELKDMPEIDLVVSQENKSGLKSWPDVVRRGSTPDGKKAFPDFRIRSFRRARPVVKVQDGCSRFCAYCIVPYTRGKPTSARPDDVLEECRTLLANGFRELVLSGINLSQYHWSGGRDFDFWDLLSCIESSLQPDWGGKARIRLSSIDPSMLNDKALDVFSRSAMLCPHLHLSVQSGSHGVLRRMGRLDYTPGSLIEWIGEFSRIKPVFALGGDFLVGFPGESENEFEETLSFFQAMPMTYAHVFPYSSRPGTGAAKFGNDIGAKVSSARAALLRSMAMEARKRFFADLLSGNALDVVVEENNPPSGMCEYYVQCRIEGLGSEVRKGDIVTVKPLKSDDNQLITTLP